MPRHFLFRLFAAAAPARDHVPDGDLLSRFVASNDSAAFELLVHRHADAVWTAAKRIAGNEADAEDVFQATFLALLRKAGSVRESCIGGWLHRVAVNAALRLKANPEHERLDDDKLRSLTLGAHTTPDDELASILHQELARLPESYRLPVVLCDLEGQTHSEAATALGWPVGSVSGRLSRARGLLRDRLKRRGLGVPTALFTAVTAPANVVSAATALAAGTALVPPAVSSLAEGVLSAMRIARLKLTAVVVAASGLVAAAGIGTGYALTRPGPALTIPIAPEVPSQVAQVNEPKLADWTPKQDARGKDALIPTAFPDLKAPEGELLGQAKLLKLCPLILGSDPPAVVATDDTYRRLLKARLHQGRLELQRIQEIIAVGNFNTAFFLSQVTCLNDMRTAAIELWSNEPKVLIPWLEEFVIMGKVIEQFITIRVTAGNEPPQSLYGATRHRLEAEAALWKTRNAKRPGGR